ncbi:MAG TPA: hypothetical protein VL172_10030 [Kofleriaceae bacterium]|nr:hypothetical protein [Kofleriaceae bacterium]
MSSSRIDFPRPNASSLWQVLESRQRCERDAPGGIFALIVVAALVALFYLIYVH